MPTPLVSQSTPYWPTLAARVLSFVINPNFCQFMIFVYLRERISPVLALHALLFLFALPLLGYVVYVRGVLRRHNLYVLERNKRLVPFLVNILGVACFVWLVAEYYDEPGAGLMNSFLLFINLFSFIITMFWRISIHMIAAAASLALIMNTHTGFAFNWTNAALLALLVGVGWSRWYLKGHTLPQIVAGALTGFAATLLFIRTFHAIHL